MPFFTVVIPSFNRGDYIADTIDSVLRQRESDHEIIVVDDGSTDSTLDVLSRYRDRIQVHTQANAGPGAARNLALRHATGRYVAFLDSDDLWPTWTLSTYKAAIEAADSPGIVSGPWQQFTGAQSTQPTVPPPLEFKSYASFFRSPVGWHLPSATAMRRDVLTAVGGFTTASCEDVDIWLRIGGFPGFVELSSPPCCLYRTNSGGISATSAYRFNGIRHLIRTEAAGSYGGTADRDTRQLCVAQAVRTGSMFYLQRGCPGMALSLYWKSLGWQLQQGRVTYVFAFPFLAAWRTLGVGSGK